MVRSESSISTGKCVHRYEHFDYELCQKILQLLKGAYPARLKKVLIVAAPLWFRAPFKILRLFVREKLRDRVSTSLIEHEHSHLLRSESHHSIWRIHLFINDLICQCWRCYFPSFIAVRLSSGDDRKSGTTRAAHSTLITSNRIRRHSTTTRSSCLATSLPKGLEMKFANDFDSSVNTPRSMTQSR